ncbi:MAG: arylsulfatase [Pirellulales bacterium]|nr:arylsulfatase [Pirellulales bacterium]
MTCRLLLLLCVGIFGWLSPSVSAEPATASRPNIIFILADDLGYGDLGCYGQKQILTPRLDLMAEQGMRFTDCYAGSTVCAPSRCCLLTGFHTGHAWVRGNRNRKPLRPEDVTVAEVLKQAGYATGAIGKWALGYVGDSGFPGRQGFDSWFGYLDQSHAHNYYPVFLWRNDQKVPLRNKVQHVIGGVNCYPRGMATERVDYSHDLFTDEALRFVGEHAEEPFFLYLAYTIPHANNEAGRLGKAAPPYRGMEVPDYGPYADKDWPAPQKGHAAMISRMDADVGRLLDLLKTLKIDEKTIVFFSSDNGPHREGGADPAFFGSSGGLRGFKRSLHDGGIRVPMIVRWPGHVPAGTTSDLPCAFWDFLPTAAELAGSAAPSGLDGISLLPMLLGKSGQKKHDFLYWEFRDQGSSQAVRTGRWKSLVKKAGQPLELYDLATDPAEQHNVAAEHPDVVARIEKYLKTARSEPAG